MVALFINPVTSRPRSLYLQEKVKETLERKGVDYSVFGSNYPTSDELNSFTDCIIVGGDGTLNFVFYTFPEINIPVGIITAGTGNDFAKKLIGNQTIDRQIEISLNGPVKPIDIGFCNGKVFLNGLGIGFDGKVAGEMRRKRFFSGKTAYYTRVLPLIFSYRGSTIKITTDQKERRINILMITIANGSFFGGGFHITPLADMYDELLDVCLVKNIPVYKRIFHLPSIEKGNHLKLPFIEYFKTSNILIEADEVLPAHLDGEFFLSNRFEVRIIGKRRFRTGG